VPYIKQEDRELLNPWIDDLFGAMLVDNRVEGSETNRELKAGEYNYIITRLANYFLAEKGLNYANVNELIGALECAKLELYRRVASPYEDKKLAENGDAYDGEIL
jgi:hypothetical protein